MPEKPMKKYMNHGKSETAEKRATQFTLSQTIIMSRERQAKDIRVAFS
jgi:hypothetical protein